MSTECTLDQLEFHTLGGRDVVGRFDVGRITSDGGGLLLREVDQRLGVLARVAECFSDYRNPNSVEHSVRALVPQRVYGLALGYENLNDHDALRADSLLALLVGKRDLSGAARERSRDRGYPLAGSSTLNRLELGHPNATAADRYKRISADPGALDRLLVDVFLESYAKAPREIWLDLDATDDPLHGHQEGRFFHGYYRCYCYLPLYIFCGEHLLCARLRASKRDGAAGSVEELERIVTQIRARWPTTRIVIRGDSGFCRDAIMSWCRPPRGLRARPGAESALASGPGPDHGRGACRARHHRPTGYHRSSISDLLRSPFAQQTQKPCSGRRTTLLQARSAHDAMLADNKARQPTLASG